MLFKIIQAMKWIYSGEKEEGKKNTEAFVFFAVCVVVFQLHVVGSTADWRGWFCPRATLVTTAVGGPAYIP